MKSRLLVVFCAAALLFFTACGGSGYSRSYIISEGAQEETPAEPAQKL